MYGLYMCGCLLGFTTVRRPVDFVWIIMVISDYRRFDLQSLWPDTQIPCPLQPTPAIRNTDLCTGFIYHQSKNRNLYRFSSRWWNQDIQRQTPWRSPARLQVNHPAQGPGGASLMPVTVILLLLTARLLLVYLNGFDPQFTHQQPTLGWKAYHVCDLLMWRLTLASQGGPALLSPENRSLSRRWRSELCMHGFQSHE